MDDGQLLKEYTRDGSQAAFGSLVERYVDMVYSAARRQVADPGLAEDVTQGVFVLMGRRAGSIRRPGALAGWLIRVTRYAAWEAMKQRGRRQYHEQQAAAMRKERVEPAEEPAWETYAPMVDEALGRLGEMERSAVALRYLRGLSLREVGEAMGVSEEAARKRVDRGIVKLQGLVAKKVAVPSAAALSATLAARGVEAAPAGLAQAATAAGGAGGTGSAGVIAKGAMKMMVWAKVKVAAVALAAALMAAVGTAEIVTHSGDRTSAAPSVAAKSEGVAAGPTTVPAGPKDGLRTLAEHIRSMDIPGVVDCFYAQTPDERQFAKVYAENIVAMERFKREMELRFGRDDRYSLMGGGNMAALLPLDRATEHVTGDRGSVDVALAPDNTISAPMRRVEGKWRLPVGEMWDMIQKAASKQGGQVPPIKQVAEQAERSTPVYLRLADAVNHGSYKSADAALAALQSDLAAANTAAATRNSR